MLVVKITQSNICDISGSPISILMEGFYCMHMYTHIGIYTHRYMYMHIYMYTPGCSHAGWQADPGTPTHVVGLS